MPNWKKLLSSGSNGALNQLYVETSITASAFKGDGSQLTGIIAPGTLSGSSQVDITQTTGYNTFSSSIQTYTDAKVASLVDSAPGTLDTLNELAAALNDDPNFSASIATSIGNRVLTSTFNTYSGSSAAALRAEYTAAIPTNNNQLTNGAGYITGHPSISAASSVNNSGRTYIQDITLDSNGHVTGIASATETVTNTDTNYYLDGITKAGNTLTFSVNGTTNQTYEFGANAFTSTTIPTNNNQLTNGAGYTTNTGDVTLTGTQTISGRKTFTDAVVLKGQATNYDASTGRTSYWSYDDKVALALEPAADDGAVAIFFKSIGNAPSDFGYIVFDEDYGEAGVTAGENCALIIGCENDGGGSSDHVRVKSRLVVEADMSSSDPTMAFQVKSSNTTSDLFNVAVAGGGYLSGTFNVTGDVVAYYSSDERLKDNLVPIGNASEKVKQLTGYEFDWNDKQDVYEGHDIGVVAQEVEKVLPEVVTTRDNGYKAVKYEKLVALLIQSNKELIERVELLEKQLNAK